MIWRSPQHLNGSRAGRRPCPGEHNNGGPRGGGMEEHFSWARGYAEKANRHIQERRPEQQDVPDNDKQNAQPAERPVPPPQNEQPTERKDEGPPPEKNHADWRRMLHLPDDRHQVDERDREVREPQRPQTRETPQQVRPTGDQPEKKSEEREVDWRRSLTDPDYRRQVRSEERAQKLERTEERHPDRAPSGHER